MYISWYHIFSSFRPVLKLDIGGRSNHSSATNDVGGQGIKLPRSLRPPSQTHSRSMRRRLWSGPTETILKSFKQKVNQLYWLFHEANTCQMIWELGKFWAVYLYIRNRLSFGKLHVFCYLQWMAMKFDTIERHVQSELVYYRFRNPVFWSGRIPRRMYSDWWI